MHLTFYIICSLGVLTTLMMPSVVHAHDEGPTAPIYLAFRYYTSGPLYDRLREEFRPEWESLPEELRINPTYGVNESDLNNDSIAELIVRFTDHMNDCNENGCHNYVISITDEKITRLGFFENAEVNVATTQTNGVKDLIVFDNHLNDFSGSLFIWNNELQRYTKK